MSSENDLYRALFESAGDAILLVEQGHFAESNASAQAMFGCGREELAGETFLRFSPSIQPDGCDSARVLEEKMSAVLSGERLCFEWRCRRLDGSTFDAQVSLKRIKVGKKTLVQVLLREVTGRKQFQGSHFRDMALSESDWVWQVDSEGRYTYCSEWVVDVLGYTVEEMLGSVFFELMRPDEATRVSELFADAVAHKKSIVELKSWNVGKDGREICLLTNGIPLLDQEGDLKGYLGVSKDITERKRLEEQIQASLERRGRQVQTSAEIAQEIAAAPALDELFRRVVTLVKERFDYYHAQIFRYDPDLDAVVLVMGYGEAGEKMLAKGHRLERGQGVVGTAAATGRPVLASDVTQDPAWVPHSYLPETKGELAVPIILRRVRGGERHDEVLGILDVQCDRAGSLTEEDQLSLEGLCGQIAIAIESTRLLEEASIFRQFADASGQGLGMADLEGNLIYGNSALCRLLGVDSSEDLIGKPLFPYYSKESQRRFRGEILPVVMEAGSWVGELDLVSVQGDVTSTIHGIFVIRDQEGYPLYLSSAITDITERKQIESFLGKRVKELDCLNDVGRKIDETPPLPEFLQWVAERIPAAMQYPDLCATAIEFNDQVYGSPEAVTLPRRIVQGLRIGNELVGRVHIAYTEDHDFLDEESAFLGDVARRVSDYINNRRLFERTQEALAQTEAFYTASQSLIAASELEELLYAVAEPALQSGANAAFLFYIDTDGKGRPERAEVVAHIPATGVEVVSAGGRYYLSDFPLARLLVANSDQPLMIGDVGSTHEALDGGARETLKTMGACAVAVVPLTLGGRWLGAVMLTWPEPLAFSPQEEQLYGVIGPQLVTLVQSRRLLEQAQHRAVQLQTAAEVSRAATSILSLDELLPQSVELVRSRFELNYAGIFLVNGEGRYAVLRAGTGKAGREMLEAGHRLEVDGDSMIGQCIAHKEARVALDVGEEAVRFENPLLPDTHSELALPLICRGQAIGALSVQSPREAAFSQEDVAVLQTVADQVANAIENARLFEQTRAALEEAGIFRQFAEASGQGLGMGNLAGEVIYANPTLCRIFGEVSPKDVLGRSLLSFYPEEVRQRVQEEIIPVAVKEGSWLGELDLVSTQGKITPTIQSIFLIRDQEGEPLYLANVVTDITERKQAEAEMEDTLRELENLNRAMSREGWQSFWTARSQARQGYLFDQTSVRQVTVEELEAAKEEGASLSHPSVFAPMIVRGEPIGVVGVRDDPEHPLSDQDRDLLESISVQVAGVLERARLFEQTQATLAQTEALYAGGDRVVRARTMDEVLQALVHSTALRHLDRASLLVFDHPWEEGGSRPPGMTISAVWERSGREPLMPTGTYYPLEQFPAASLLGLKEPSVVHDLVTDERVDASSRELFAERLGMRGVVVLPLVVGGSSIGGIVAQSRVPIDIDENELRQIDSLSDQAATVIQNLRLLEQTQAALEQVQAVHQRYLRESWRDYLEARGRDAQPAYLYDRAQIRPLVDSDLVKIEQALAQGGLVVSEGGGPGESGEETISLPIKLRGEPIGTLVVEPAPGGRSWGEEEITLMEVVSNQLALALDNARLFDETQMSAQRERVLREVTERVRATENMESLLQLAVQEVRRVLGANRAVIRLGTLDSSAPVRGDGRGEGKDNAPSSRRSRPAAESSG